MGLSTPDTRHISRPEYSSVYEPAEDTYLLLDALENDRAELQKQQPTICVEIGAGSGCVTAFLGQLLDPLTTLIISTDINPAAVDATIETVARNPSPAVFFQCRTRFLQSLDSHLHGNIDILMFNPPYVVTPTTEIDSTDEASAWAGGKNGREVLDKLLPQIPQLLSPDGRFYLVVIEQNKPDDIIQALSVHGLSGERILSRKAGREHLSILRFISHRK
ncbi:S-adenosyl-L-methionine-dependent methyltransferase [Coemansia reversa NRRL 1564]|uniref:S-adenosyl-L-methionine-dependent methyltransferase n=1 Tax=Coemansia reversa (strain ATCC 12441 / NRRL 1564) TaxID=763665 RepID=A0A2G5BDL2_COERN|nr:S-adenosyl-L-methionine-dependent methyltransferase [Coemansia reversa NRRL 1564]|eukprot:PIA17072.1 S-adenosyl-L-methionine-dependent methyltransferase [Coemansia reversa NRRL 1564]